MNPTIKYKAGFKYQLYEDYSIRLGNVQLKKFPLKRICKDRYLSLSPKGLLRIRTGYSWDGPSGLTIDTKNFMRGSLAHDAMYQLMREALLGF